MEGVHVVIFSIYVVVIFHCSQGVIIFLDKLDLTKCLTLGSNCFTVILTLYM